MISISTPRSSKPPDLLMPTLNMMSNSACLKGGATLFFTTFALTLLPTAVCALLDRFDPSQVDTHGTVEFERASAGCDLGTTEEHPHFLPQLFTNTTAVCERLVAAVSLRNAWDISRACRPTWASPMSPSSSAFGTNAATLSITTTSTAPLRTRYSTISNACSPESGCEIRSESTCTPHFAAYEGSIACSASM